MNLRNSILALLFSLVLLGRASPLHAQDEPESSNESKPKPAGSSFPIPAMDDQQEQSDQNTLAPDTTPLTGILTPTLGSPETRHSYWVPGIQWSGSIQSNPYNTNSNSGWLMNNFVIANLSLLQVWGRSQLAINYSGGGFFSTDSTQGNGSYQQLAISQTFQWERWQVRFLDQFSYLPQTSLGFGGGTGLGIPGTGSSVGPVIPGTGTSYLPNQSIYNAIGPRYSNASVVQMTYSVTPRGSITFGGSYGFLDFTQAGNVDNQSATGTIGYNYLLTGQDTLGAFYRFSSYHFSGEPVAYGDHSINVAYGRKLTGHLALQLYAGPDFTTSRATTTSSGSSSGSGSGSGSGSNTTTDNTLTYGVNVGANLAAAFHNGGLTFNYSHGITGGSGVLSGSTADLVNFTGNHRVGRIWTAHANAGYAHNKPISGFTPSISQSYNTYDFGGGISRPFGRNATFGVAYNATISTTNISGCTGTACTPNQTYNYVTINFQWHAQPMVLP